jgi:hypothetical protein
MLSQNICIICTNYVTQIQWTQGTYILSAREINSHGLNDGRGYRVSDTMGLKNVGYVVAPFLPTSDMIVTIHRTLNHNDTTTNNTPASDLRTNNQGSKQVGPYVFRLGEHSPRMRRTSFQICLRTITLQGRVYSVRQ